MLYKYREDHTMKISRKRVNLDLLRWLLLSSDPVVSESTRWPKKISRKLSEDAKTLLEEEETDTDNSTDSETDCDE